MGKTIGELILFCENLEKYHRTQCKRYDDASGYTRSHIEEIRTNEAKREEMDSKFYHELKKIVRKYQKIEQIVGEKGMPEWSYSRFMEIASIVRGYEDGNVD